MQKFHSCGLFAYSLRPSEPLSASRTYLRQRESLVAGVGTRIQLMQKALTVMHVQLANVISDIRGDTSFGSLITFLVGKRDPRSLARLKGWRIRATEATMTRTLEGHFES